MGEIIVKLYGILSESAETAGRGGRPGDEIHLSVQGALSVREILVRMEIPEDRVRLTFSGKKKVSLTHELREGETLHVFPPMAGG